MFGRCAYALAGDGIVLAMNACTEYRVSYSRVRAMMRRRLIPARDDESLTYPSSVLSDDLITPKNR